MFEFIICILIIVLFVKISNANDRIDYLSARIAQMNSDKQPQEKTLIEEQEPSSVSKESANKERDYPEETKKTFKILIESKQEPVQTKAEKINQAKEEEIFSYTQEELTKEKVKEEAQEKEETSSAVQFTTAKLFSWIAAVAFILAVIFGLIYVVQNEIISKQMITVCAGGIGLILLGAGLRIKDEKLKTTAGTLCASGITTFFIATYCAFSFYQMISLPVAFILMAAISFVSFFISAKKDIQFISFLGMIAAFITPILLSSGNDNYIFFFTYIAFVNGAAIAVSLKKGWHNLLITSLVFTFLCQLAWLVKDLTAVRVNIFQIVFTLYSVALAAAYINLKDKLPLLIKYTFCAFIILGAFMIIPLMLRLDPACGVLINLLIMSAISYALVSTLYYGEPDIFKTPIYIISVIFLLSLLTWTNTSFAMQTGGLLLLFAILGASLANSLVINVKTGEIFTTIINLIALFIIFVNITQNNLKLENIFMVHNGAMVFNLALFSIAYKFRNRLTPLLKTALGSYIVASLVFSFLFMLQANTPKDFVNILANVFIVDLALLWLAFKEGQSYKLPLRFCSVAILVILYYMLSVKAALLPYAFGTYLLLGAANLFINTHLWEKEGKSFSIILAALWFISMFNTNNMYYIWFAAIILNFVCLGLAKAYKKPGLILIAALGSSFLFIKAHDAYQISISCIFFLLFFVCPFLYKKDFEEDSSLPWLASAYMGLTAWLIIISHSYFNLDIRKGLIALPFAALFLLNAKLLYKDTFENKNKTSFTIVSMAAMFFITAAISLIFARGWLTLALAAEGAALIVLNKKVPTNWNPKIGFVLLVLAFVRLVLIGGFFPYYTSEAKIFNWYLVVYSLSAAAMFVSARYWITEEQEGANIKNILNIAGAILVFFLINIEIANYFSASGKLLKFNFFGDFASTITYTIAWTLYGAVTCLIAFYNKHKTVLKIGVVIMMLSIAKLFLFDLWSLGILYRIIGLFAMAGILFGISLIFQKFKDRLKE